MGTFRKEHCCYMSTECQCARTGNQFQQCTSQKFYETVFVTFVMMHCLDFLLWTSHTWYLKQLDICLCSSDEVTVRTTWVCPSRTCMIFKTLICISCLALMVFTQTGFFTLRCNFVKWHARWIKLIHFISIRVMYL